MNVFLRLICMLALLSIFLVACQDKSTDSNDENSEEKLVFLTPGDNAANAINPDDRIIEEINNLLEIDLEVEFVPEGGYEKINVAIASGDLPDVLTINYPSPTLQQWINEGILIPLNEYLPMMPTVKSKIEENLEWTAIDGEYYGYPFIEDRANSLITYRADWLE